MSPLRLSFGDVDDGFGEILWGFLRQVVPDAAGDRPVRVLAGELLGIGTRIRVRGTVGTVSYTHLTLPTTERV